MPGSGRSITKRCVDEICLDFITVNDNSSEDEGWRAQLYYGRYATAIYVAVILAFTLIYLCSRFHKRQSSRLKVPEKPSPFDRLRSIWRWMTYRRPAGRVGRVLDLPSVGVMILFASSLSIALGLSFAERPYYLPKRSMGSPRLGLRAGMIAVALVPLVIILAGKVTHCNFSSVPLHSNGNEG
jgi:hypothetical protein